MTYPVVGEGRDVVREAYFDTAGALEIEARVKQMALLADELLPESSHPTMNPPPNGTVPRQSCKLSNASKYRRAVVVRTQ